MASFTLNPNVQDKIAQIAIKKAVAQVKLGTGNGVPLPEPPIWIGGIGGVGPAIGHDLPPVASV